MELQSLELALDQPPKELNVEKVRTLDRSLS
jgi:hypothetical protein